MLDKVEETSGRFVIASKKLSHRRLHGAGFVCAVVRDTSAQLLLEGEEGNYTASFGRLDPFCGIIEADVTLAKSLSDAEMLADAGYGYVLSGRTGVIPTTNMVSASGMYMSDVMSISHLR